MRIVFTRLVQVLALAAALTGCATRAAPPPGTTEDLERWLSGAPGETGEVPERARTPPRRVTLESLEAGAAPREPATDLPRPEYFSFRLPEAAYVSVAVTSNLGAAIALIDRSEGALGSSGQAGQADGRIDTLLDAGEYRVRTQTARETDAATVGVREYTEVQTDTALLMSSPPGTLWSATLHDYEQRSFWVRVEADGLLVLEAMGRALREVRVWRDGVWAIETEPRVGEYAPVPGQPMGYVELSYDVDPGVYRVVFYGGKARTWEAETGEEPFHVRRGGRYLGSIVDANTVLSPMGRDAFLVSGDVTVAEIENPDFVPVRLAVSRFGPGYGRHDAIASVSIERSATSSRGRTSVGRSSAPRWLSVAGTPGDTVRIRALPERGAYEIETPTPGSQYLISTISSLDADHAVDATPLIVRRDIDTGREDVLRSEALRVTDTAPLVREVNLEDAVFFTVNLSRSGPWALYHDRPGSIAVSILPLRDITGARSPDIRTDNPASFDLEAGEHVVALDPNRPGVGKFVLYYRGTAPAAADQRAVMLLRGSGPVPRQDITYVTLPGQILPDGVNQVVVNPRGGPTTALFVERLPLDLAQAVPLTLAAGETLAIPVSPHAPGTLSSGYASLRVARAGLPLAPGEVIPKGQTTVTVSNTGSSTTTFVLRLDPVYVSDFVAPEVPRLETLLEVLRPGVPVFHDYARGQAREFLLVVDQPGFYELGTSGRLAMRLTTRTPVRPRGHEAATNGPGRNALVQAYFRPGKYLVQATATQASMGRAGLSLTPLPMLDLGRLREGVWSRTELARGVGVEATVTVPTEGEYVFRTVGLYGSPTTRLEDADAWPVDGPRLGPGFYRYYSWPQTVWSRRLTGYFRTAAAPELAEDQPWPLVLGGAYRRVWNERPDRVPHLFVIRTPAAVPVSLRTSALMKWWVANPQGLTVVEGQGNQDFVLPAGLHTVSIRTREQNNNVRYDLSLTTAALVAGLDQQVRSLPAKIPVIAGTDGIYDLWSAGTWDVRATLRTADGQTVLAYSDDGPGDWNFHLSRYLPAGEYMLDVQESFRGSGVVTVSCQLREEVWVETRTLPLSTRLSLDKSVLGIPFRTGPRDALVQITSDLPSVELALYRDETLVAVGRDTLAVPLLADRLYLLRVRNDDTDAATLALDIQAPETRSLTWGGAQALALPAGAVIVANATGISAQVPDGLGRLLLSGAPERVATEPKDGVIAAPRGTLWSWYEGEDAAIEPLGLVTGRPRVFDITDDDVSLRVTTTPDHVYVLEARSATGYLGMSDGVFPAAPGTRAWSGIDLAPSSSILGMAGGATHQVWLWDGEPRVEGRRVELTLRAFALGRELSQADLGPLALSPGEAVTVRAQDTAALRLLLSPDVVAFAAPTGTTTQTIAARNESRSADMAGGHLYVVNTGSRERVVRVEAAPPRSPLTVAAMGLETRLSAPGALSARVQASGGQESDLAVWAVEPTEVTLLTENGRRVVARPPDAARSYWLLPGVPGTLRVTSGAGPVVAWTGNGAEGLLAWASRGAGGAAPLVPGSNPMKAAPERWRFSLDRAAFVIAATSNRGITVLEPGASAGLPLYPALGSGGERTVFAALPAGTHAVVTRPFAGEPQPDALHLQVLDPVSITENEEPAPRFLAPGEWIVFEVAVQEKTPVGIGLEAQTDEYTTHLFDEGLHRLGSGRLFYRELESGRYYFLVENGPHPMRVRPVIVADQGSRRGVPEDVIRTYRER